MKLSTVSLLCAIAYACGALARAQECETEAFNNLPELCRIERRLSEGAIEERSRLNRTYYFWVRGPASETWERKSFHSLTREINRPIYGYAPEPILVYVCD